MKQFSLVLFAVFFLFASDIRAQIFPYRETFDSYTAAQPLNGNGGLVSSPHVYVTPYGVSGNGVEFRMTDTALVKSDTISSPLIGPLTAHTVTSFYFRAVTMSNGIPTVYHMSGRDQAVIYVGTATFNIAIPQDTIDSITQNTAANYVKVVVPVPAFLNTYSGKFRIVTSNPDGHNWLLQMDSLVVKDTIPIPPVLTDSIGYVSCRGQNTGSIKVLVSGDSPPFRYLWSTGDTTQSITGQFAGSYIVTVTDHAGSSVSITGVITEPALALIFDSLSQTPARCYGANTGSAAIYPSGGNTPYHYSWSTNPIAHTNPVTNLYAGNYTVSVTDANGCALTASIHISQPAASFSTVTSATPSSGSDGTATVAAIGGSGSTTYIWSTSPPQTTSTATGLPAGYVVVTVTNGTCQLIDSIYVPHPAGVNDIGTPVLSLYPNPASHLLYIDLQGVNTSANYAIITDMSGRIILSQQMISDKINTSTLSNGLYQLCIKTAEQNYAARLIIQR